MTQTLSPTGLRMLKGHEGFRRVAYDDFRPNYQLQNGDEILGTLTIGYGHTGPEVRIGQTVTQLEAAHLLRKDVAWAEEAVRDLVTTDLTQNQFDALVSFTYNVGRSNFARSTLLKRVNSRRFVEAGEEFKKWRKSKGVVLAGLVRRRAEEAALFLSGMPAVINDMNAPPAPRQSVEPVNEVTEHDSVNQSGSVNATRVAAGAGSAGSVAMALAENAEPDMAEIADTATQVASWVNMVQDFAPWVLLAIVVGTWLYVEHRRRKQIKEAKQ